MPRYGDLDKLKSEFEWLLSQVGESSKDEIREHIQRIDKAPTADVVEVVRCKECKYCDIGENEVDAWCDCRIFNISGSEDFYCSCGERRDDG